MRTSFPNLNRPRSHPCWRAALKLCLALALASLLTPALWGAVLYSSDFSNFPVGDDQLVGHDGWQGNSVGEGVHGIGANMAPGLGNSAWLGYGLPSTNLVRVYRNIGVATNAGAPAKIQLQTVLGITSSILGDNDIFNISFYNTSGVFLASLKFNTTQADYGLWTDDGVTKTFLGPFFRLNDLHSLFLEIDFPQNLWSGYLDDLALFQRARFSALPATRNAGSFSVEWQVVNLQNPGDNWLLFDNLSVVSPDLRLTSVRRLGNGTVSLEWTVPKAGSCQVQVSTNLVAWVDLPGAVVQASEAGETLSYLDSTASALSQRFYRIKQ